MNYLFVRSTLVVLFLLTAGCVTGASCEGADYDGDEDAPGALTNVAP